MTDTTPAERAVHRCHWPDCNKPVPPRMWGCSAHWFRLPLSIRKKVLATYRPGQESDRKVSREYIEAALEARNWALDVIGKERQP